MCVCDFSYIENKHGQCVPDEDDPIHEANKAVGGSNALLFAVLTGFLFLNPSIFVSFLDSL